MTPSSKPWPLKLDVGEPTQVISMGAAELDAAAGRGEITDAKTLVGLLWLQRWQAGAWPLVWLAPLSAPVLKPVDAPPVAALHNRAS